MHEGKVSASVTTRHFYVSYKNWSASFVRPESVAGAEMGKTIFVTGAGGFVGSHSVLELLEEGYDIVAVDNFVNAVKGDGAAMPESLRRVERYTKKKIVFYEVDLCDKKALKSCFSKARTS